MRRPVDRPFKKTWPIRRGDDEGYQCYFVGEEVPVDTFRWDMERPVFVNGSGLHGTDPQVPSAAIAAYQMDAEGKPRFLKMRVPQAMRQLAGTAEYLVAGVACRHAEDPGRAIVVSDSLCPGLEIVQVEEGRVPQRCG